MKSVGQRAAKLQAVRYQKKVCRQASVLIEPLSPGLTPSGQVQIILKAWRMEVQEAGSILKVYFALFKWPRFHRAYLVTEW